MTAKKVEEGIGRKIWEDGELAEGYFHKNKLFGYARSIYSSGNYYIGMHENHKRHGYGRYVYIDGTV